MKIKKKKPGAIVLAVFIIALAAGAVFAYKYINAPAKTIDVTFTYEKTTVEPPETETLPTEPTKKDETEKSGEKTVFNCPGSENDYEATAFEAKLFNAINAEREKNSLPALNWNSCLHTRAKTRADELQDCFSHTRPDGKKPSSVLTDDGISFTLFGECLAKGAKENDEGVSLILNGLMKEQSQQELLFGKDYPYAAVAVSTDKNGEVYAVILFCSP